MCVLLLSDYILTQADVKIQPVATSQKKLHLEGKHVQATLYFPVWPRSRRRSWSLRTRSAGPSRVSLLILETQGKFGAYSRDSSRITAALYGCFCC